MSEALFSVRVNFQHSSGRIDLKGVFKVICCIKLANLLGNPLPNWLLRARPTKE